MKRRKNILGGGNSISTVKCLMSVYVTDGDGSLQAAEVPLPLWAADIRAGPLDIGGKKVV